jgi:TolB protein
VNADGLNVRRVTTTAAEHEDAPIISPDGASIAYDFSSSTIPRRIEVISPDGTNRRILAGDGMNDSPRWAPDGARIAFCSNRASGGGTSGVFELYVMQADGSKQTRLTSLGATRATFPAWSPDGARLAFQAGIGSGPYSVYVVNADGNGLRKLNDNGGSVAWKP